MGNVILVKMVFEKKGGGGVNPWSKKNVAGGARKRKDKCPQKSVGALSGCGLPTFEILGGGGVPRSKGGTQLEKFSEKRGGGFFKEKCKLLGQIEKGEGQKAIFKGEGGGMLAGGKG